MFMLKNRIMFPLCGDVKKLTKLDNGVLHCQSSCCCCSSCCFLFLQWLNMANSTI